MDQVLRLAVVGCGYWGPNLIRNFNALPNCTLAAVCDRDEKRLRHIGSLYRDVVTTTEFERVIEDESIDAVAIATPVFLHHKLAMQSLAAGKHTFVEKPLAASVAECDDLIQLAADKDLRLMVGHTFLYSSPVRMIKGIVDAGQIGDIRYIGSRRLNLGLFQKDINVVWDLAPHDLSIILHIMGAAPTAVNCQGNAHVTAGIEDIANMSLSFDNHRFAIVQNSWLDPRKVREMTIVGTEQMIVYDDLEPLQKIKIHDMRVDPPPHYDTFGEFQYSYHYGDMRAPYIRQEEPLKVECDHFLHCIRTGEEPITRGEQGRDIIRILEAADRSLAQGGARVELGTL